MNKIIFIMGEPGSGKTFLADRIVENRSCGCLSVDKIYVQYVKEKCDELYFKALNKYIAPHYNCILSNSNYSKVQFNGRDFKDEWNKFLYKQIYDSTVQEAMVIVMNTLKKN